MAERKLPSLSPQAKEQTLNALGMLLILATLVGVFATKSPRFLTAPTFAAIASQIPDAALLAMGMTFVLLIGGIDLSVGSVVGLSGALMGMALLQWRLSLPLAALLCVASGALCGFLNGWMSVRFRLPAFIVTLGMLEAARGGTYLLTNSQTQYIGSQVEGIANAHLGGVSVSFLLTLLLAMGAQVLLSRSRFGRHVFAVGSNEEAARLSGIDTRRVKIAVFSLCGALAALAAIINVSRLASADPNAGTGYELQAIAAAVIGGTSLMGGRGSVWGSLFGALIIAVLGAGLVQVGASEPHKRLITGCVIVLAVILDVYRARLSRSAS